MNPYKPPTAGIAYMDNLPKASSWGLAFFYGCGASGLGTLVGALHYLWLHYWFLNQGIPPRYLYGAILTSPTVNCIGHVVNTACGLLAGYLLAGRVSAQTWLLGAITGLPFLIHAALPYLTEPRPMPWWSQILLFFLPIPVGILGVWLGQRYVEPANE